MECAYPRSCNFLYVEIIDSFIELGADIPACFYSYNQKVQGLGEKLIKLRQNLVGDQK